MAGDTVGVRVVGAGSDGVRAGDREEYEADNERGKMVRENMGKDRVQV